MQKYCMYRGLIACITRLEQPGEPTIRRCHSDDGLCVLLAACSSGSSSSTAGSGTSNGGWATSPVRLVYAGLAPTHIDPRQATDLDSFTVTRNLYDPLVWSTP